MGAVTQAKPMGYNTNRIIVTNTFSHTGHCKSTGGYYNALVSAFFRIGAEEITIPTVIITFVRA